MQRSLVRGRAQYPVRVDVEANPPQPDQVTAAIGAVLTEAATGTDPWWQAGIDEALGQSDD